MKQLLTISLIFMVFLQGYCQKSNVNLDDPISEIDISYHEGIVRLSVILNNIDANASEIQNDLLANITVSGKIHWGNLQENIGKNTLKTIPLQPFGKDKPYLYYTDLIDGTNSILRQTTKSHNWNKLSLKVNYLIDGKRGETPIINFYPPKQNIISNNTTINIDQKGFKKDSKKALIQIKSNPVGTPFELRNLTIREIIGTSSNSMEVPTETLESFGYTRNGNLSLAFDTNFEINSAPSSRYIISCIAGPIGESENSFEVLETEVIFTDDLELVVENRDIDYSLSLPSNSTSYTDKSIRIKGKGDLNIEFPNFPYNSIKANSTNNSDGTYDITLSNFSDIPLETSSLFYYTDGKKRISPAYTIKKSSPKVNDLKFNGINSDSLKFTFSIVGNDETAPSIKIKNDSGASVIFTGGIIKPNGKNNYYDVLIDNKVSSLIKADELVKDLPIYIVYGDIEVFQMTLTLLNKNLYDAKILAINEEAQKKKNKRDPEKIKNLVEDFVKHADLIGKAISNEDVIIAIEQLQTADTDKVKNTLNDIGKWALIAGKILLPILV